MKSLSAIALAAACIVSSTAAYAKRDKRDGLNFGLNLRMVSDDDKSLAGDETNKNSHTETNATSVSPYIGLVFLDYFNMGLSGMFEQSSSHERTTSQKDDSKIDRTSESTLKGLSIFARFLFGKFMYFEGGFGVYDRRMNVQNQYTTEDGDGIFTGKREEYSVHGLGPGYHLGAGIEIAVINGFYFTSSYMHRGFTLRDRSSDSLGKKRAKVEQRELAFGIAHYVD
jgi:hypothetical protein